MYPDVIPKFTPRDANPKYQVASVIATINHVGLDLSKKMKPKASPPSTPAHERVHKKQTLKPVGAKDFTKAGLFHSMEGVPHSDYFPSNLSKKLCSFFLFPQQEMFQTPSGLQI